MSRVFCTCEKPTKTASGRCHNCYEMIDTRYDVPDQEMPEFDFSKAVRGPVIITVNGKKQINKKLRDAAKEKAKTK